MNATTTELITAEQLLAMSSDDLGAVELVDGVLHRMPTAGGAQGIIAGRLLGDVAALVAGIRRE